MLYEYFNCLLIGLSLSIVIAFISGLSIEWQEKKIDKHLNKWQSYNTTNLPQWISKLFEILNYLYTSENLIYANSINFGIDWTDSTI